MWQVSARLRSSDRFDRVQRGYGDDADGAEEQSLRSKREERRHAKRSAEHAPGDGREKFAEMVGRICR